MIQYSKTITSQIPDVDEEWIIYWLHVLIDNRTVALAQFLQTAVDMGIPKDAFPRLWLKLQLHDEEDFFDETFQLWCLTGPQLKYNEYRDNALEWISAFLGPSYHQFFYCLDEAQAELSTKVRRHKDSHSLLNLWAYMTQYPVVKNSGDLLQYEETPLGAMLDRDLSSCRALATKSIFSGTSLKTTDAFEAVEHRGSKISISGRSDTFIYSNFPMIRDDEHFAAVAAQNGMANLLQCKSRDSDCLIFQHAAPLYGRPRWSALYVELLKDKLSQHPVDRDATVKEAAEEIQQAVKTDLQRRLHQLRRSDSLMRDLCRVTVWSDLLDRPTPFWDDHGPTMISEAFAVTKNVPGKGSQYYLDERLALEAAKEFFLVEMPNLIERTLGDFLERHAHDANVFGKAAEYYLAWNLNRAFVDNADRLSGSTDAHRLRSLLDMLGRAEHLNGKQAALDLSNHTLVKGGTIGHVYDGSVELHTWMSRVREQQTNIPPNASFFFPDNNAGPDLLFALQPTTTPNRGIILCLLQLKCGAAKLEHGIKSTSLSNSYHSKHGNVLKGYKDRYSDLQTELQAWEQKRLRILRVFVTAAVTEREEQDVVQGSSCPEYYIRCDASQTELLFGSKFRLLLEAVRSQKLSLSEIYDKVNDGEALRERKGKRKRKQSIDSSVKTQRR